VYENAVEYLPYEDCSEYLTDSTHLDRFYRENGYLFLRGVLNDRKIGNVAAQMLDGLRDLGHVPENSSLDNLRLNSYEAVDEAALHGYVDYDSFWNDRSTLTVFEHVFGEPIRVFKSTTIRYYPAGKDPAGPKYITPLHQDGYYVGPNKDFRTVWVPLLPTSLAIGGVALAAGSHTQGSRDHVRDERYELFGSTVSGVPADRLSEFYPLRFSPMEPGDVLIFHAYLCHRSVPNLDRAGKIRMSMDTRVQPASTPVGYYAATSWVKSFNDAAKFRMNSATNNSPTLSPGELEHGTN
jgi:1-deoxypentalenic acid 11beta-hydroxylase